MTSRRHSFKEVAAALKATGRAVCEHLLPGGMFAGGEYLALSTRKGGPGDSLKINLKTGSWGHFSGDRNGGDFISFWAYVKGIKNGEAKRQAEAWLGWSDETFAPRPGPFFVPAAKSPEEEAADEDRERQEKIARAKRTWDAAGAPRDDTATVRYLRARGFTGPIPPALRHHGNLGYWINEKDQETGEDRLLQLGKHPALVAAVQSADRSFLGAQRIYLTEEGGKAQILHDGQPQDTKKAQGPIGGGAVWLSAPGPIAAVTEGIETALSILEARPELFVLAAVTAQGMKMLELPEGVREVIVCADNDRTDAGLAAAQHAAGKWTKAGLAVRVTMAPGRGEDEKSKDFNDTLMEHGPATVRHLIDSVPPWEAAEVEPYYPDNSEPAEVASKRLDDAVTGYFDRALARSGDEDDYPVEGIKGGAGLGKSEMVLDYLARPEMADLNVNYFFSNHRLGDELLRRFKEKVGPNGSRGIVFRGRSQEMPDGTPMCTKPDVADTVNRLGRNVQQTLCHRDGRDGSEEAFCEHHPAVGGDCPYQRQLLDSAPAVRFMPHQYMFQRKFAPVTRGQINIIDEAFHTASLRGADGPLKSRPYVVLPRLKTSRFVPRLDGRGDDMGAMADLDTVSRRIARVIEAGDLSVGAFHAEGVTAEFCWQAHGYEIRRIEALDISPDMDVETQKSKLASAEATEALWFARLFWLLAETLGNECPEVRSLVLMRNVTTGEGRLEDRVYMRWSGDLKISKAPTLYLDASMDETIARRFLPAMSDPTVIEAERRNVHVKQIDDRVVGKSMLVESAAASAQENARRANRRDDLRALLEVVVAEAFASVYQDKPDALLVTYKDAAKAMDPVEGAEVAWFNAIRGKDTWRNVSGLIVAGRPQPSVQDLEALTDALFWKDPRPILRIQPGPHGSSDQKRYPKEKRALRTPDGSENAIDVEYHPDPLCDAVLRQIREAELIQAVDRARLIWRDASRSCLVIILTSIVLPITVNEQTKWDAVIPNPLEIMQARGAVPENHKDMAACYPDLFPSQNAAQKALDLIRERSKEKSAKPLLVLPIGIRRTFLRACYRLAPRREGERPRIRYLTFDPDQIADPAAWLEERLGPLSHFEIIEQAETEDVARDALPASPNHATPIPTNPPKESPPMFAEKESEPDTTTDQASELRPAPQCDVQVMPYHKVQFDKLLPGLFMDRLGQPMPESEAITVAPPMAFPELAVWKDGWFAGLNFGLELPARYYEVE